MNLNITGRHLEITPALQNHIENKFIKIKSHFNEVIDAKFILSVEKLNSIVDVTIHLPHLNINAKSINEDSDYSFVILNRIKA
jgi:putative sigma-54 modulation protein